MPLKRKLWIAAAFLAVLAALVYGFVPEAMEVETAKVETGPMMVTVDEEGKTLVKDRYVLSAPVPGYMRRLSFDVGDSVARGQTVIELEPLRSQTLDPRARAAAEAEVSAATSSLAAARQNEAARKSEAWLAKEELARAKALFDGGHISRSAFDRAQSSASQTEAALSAASSGVKTAQAGLERARASLGYSPADEAAKAQTKAVSVRSPVKGRVLKLHKESEGAVAAGEPLVDVGDTASLEVRAEVLSSDAVSIKAHAPVFFERWGGSTRLEGRVRSVEPAAFTKVSSLGVEEQRVVVISDIISAPEEWQKLGDGYRVEARFVVWESQKALKVPSSAVFRTLEKNAVFVVKDGRALERQIKAGQMNGVSAEVIEGLSEGEEVVIHPDDALRDGARVKKAAPSGRK